MLAYRVNLSGTHDHYLITEKQKPALDAALKENRGVVIIGGDTIRVNSIKSITQAEVDPGSCPAYFQAQVKREKDKEAAASAHGFHQLPSEHLLLSMDGRILRTDASRQSLKEVSKSLLSRGDPREDKNLRFLLAECHFKYGVDGQKQYFTALDQLPEALKCRPEKDDANGAVVECVFHYGLLT